MSVVKETKSRKGKGLSLWLQPKNRIKANLALWLEAGRAKGVRQADNLELKSWLIYQLPVSMLPQVTE